jgi:hypothetical protein
LLSFVRFGVHWCEIITQSTQLILLNFYEFSNTFEIETMKTPLQISPVQRLKQLLQQIQIEREKINSNSDSNSNSNQICTSTCSIDVEIISVMDSCRTCPFYIYDLSCIDQLIQCTSIQMINSDTFFHMNEALICWSGQVSQTKWKQIKQQRIQDQQ